MKPPKLIITKQDLLEKPCSDYYKIPEGEFDAGEKIEKYGNHYWHVSWLIRKCEKAQTEEWFEYYKSLNPSYENVSWFIANCKKAQTDEWFEYYMSLNPDQMDIIWLINNCPKAKEYFEKQTER
jgi:hypothetical protein